jgi:two-component system, OmpR family, response regulator MprA
MKPLALGELVARAHVLLRRADRAGGELLHYDDLLLDPATRKVRRGSRSIDLTRTEFELLELFMRNPGRVLSRHEILTGVWGFDPGRKSNSLNVYIGYVRKKIESNGKPRLLHTVRGVGYVLRRP